MEVTKMWLSPKELAVAYELSYHEALRIAKSGEVGGYWSGNRFKFNAHRAQEAYESGVFEEVLSTR